MASIFISHRGDDLAEAEQLSVELRNAGHDVWLDEWEIDLGDSIIEKMNRGLEDSAYLILCYSSKGVLSPWISREWMSALAKQLNGLNVKILPVLLAGGKPPAILADIKYADLVKDWAKGVSNILSAIR